MFRSSHQTNGDQHLYSDASATYTKVVLQDSIGLVNPAAYRTFTTALASGKPSDFENIIIGGTRPLNGPQGGLAFTLEGTDSHQFGSSPSPHNQETQVVVPAPPAFSSPAWGTELAELYWCSLLRDTAFTDYPTSPIAAAACAELTSMPSYAGPRTHSGQVTPNLLFRGHYPGETLGPYISQLIITPSFFGAMPLTNQFITYQAGLNYMLDPVSFLQVQNGITTGLSNQPDPTLRFLHDGRGLCAWTRVDVLFQAYFIAFLVMNTLGVPLNPGNPYVTSRTQTGFDTLGGPDISATIGEVSARVLDTVWYQKWFVHLRPRPESSGGIAYLTKTDQLGSIQARLNNNFLNSQALKASYDANNSWFLSQPFPEGAPAHPAYPTGHGVVAGACITVLKFFYDGHFVIPNPLVPAPDGLSVNPYTGPDAGSLTINGELNKLAHNISFGHGIHAGIHWRSDSDDSILLGEAFAISFLQDKIRVYNEKLTVHFTKLDGSIATISNQ
ncbi:vanadium-dependent haloperoxidase [Tunturiibacter gelidiferens]|uniref:vanadium-dependent haloperoxidase n=1 Tax=Tunturiibacter gelidiferens TaxID=3069689 RepID=UPI003D9B8869